MEYNIVTAAFGAMRAIVSCPISYQYDIGQKLVIKGVELPETYAVDFCNEGDTQTITMVGNSEGVLIPDDVLQTGKPIKAYVVVAGENDVQTRYEITIPVKKRPYRTDIQPTQAEHQQIDILIAAMNNAAGNAQQAAEDAQTAQEAAERAAETFTTDTTLSISGKAADAKATGDEIDVVKRAADTNLAQLIVGAPALTERVAGGTKILNQLWGNDLCAMAGYLWDANRQRICIYEVVSANIPEGYTVEAYHMYYRDSPDEATELTIETAPSKTALPLTDNRYTTVRARVASDTHHVDFRVGYIVHDPDGNEVRRVYSDQYRYTVDTSTGIVTRVRFETPLQDPSYITDIGVIEAYHGVLRTFNVRVGREVEMLPLISTITDPIFDFVIPDSMFDNSETGLGFCIAVRNGAGEIFASARFVKAEDRIGDLEEVVSEEIAEQNARSIFLNGENAFVPSVSTERVAGGTRIKACVWANKLVATFGYAYENSKVYIFDMMGSPVPDGCHAATYRLLEKDGQGDPYELTFENAPQKLVFSTDRDYYNARTNVSGVAHHMDWRICRIIYDADDNEVERIYSQQYRYTVENGQITREKVSVAPQDPYAVIDIGVCVNPYYSVLNKQFGADNQVTVLPLISNTSGTVDFIIPDSMFENAETGLALIAIMGDGTQYLSSAFFKAEASFPALPANDGTYTLQLVMNNGTPSLSWVSAT